MIFAVLFIIGLWFLSMVLLLADLLIQTRRIN